MIGTHMAALYKARRRRKYQRIDRDRKEVRDTREAIQSLMTDYLAKKGKQYARAVRSAMAKAADGDAGEVARIMRALEAAGLDWSDLPARIQAILEPFVRHAGQMGLQQVAVTAEATINVVNSAAVAWAKDRAAELVGMKWVGAYLVPNPDAKWQITESTRGMIRDKVTTAIAEGWSNDRLAAEIHGGEIFSEARAMMIARTETAFADVQGNMIAYDETIRAGIPLLKWWSTAGDADVSDACAMNEKQGPIPMGELFQSGADSPPEHPNCRCDLIPVRADDSDT